MNIVEIDRMVRDAVARAGHSSKVAPELGAVVLFHAMTMKNVTPELVELLIDELMPGIAQAIKEDDSIAARTLPETDTRH